MMGNKNLRLLKILLPVAAVCLLLYAFYEYKQSYNELVVQKHFLREAQEEYKTLMKRFDMLSNELKSSVQAMADLDKQQKVEKKNRIKVEKEKEELERQYQTEGVRKGNDNIQLSREKQQLVEEKDELKRERDRLSARVSSLTAEMTEQADSHTAKELQLHGDCDTKLSQQRGKVTSLSSDLSTCTSDLKYSRNRLSLCKEEVTELQHQVPQGRNTDRQFYKQDGYGHNRGDGEDLRDRRGYQSDGRYKQNYDQFHDGGRSYEDGNKFQENPRQHQSEADGVGHVRDVPDRQPHGGEMGREQKDTHPHVDEKKKREIYHSLHRKLVHGEELTEKQQRAYKLLHAVYGGLSEESHPGGAAANSLEEVRDLLPGRNEKIKGRRDDDNAAPDHGAGEHKGVVDTLKQNKQSEGHSKDNADAPMSHQEEVKGGNGEHHNHGKGDPQENQVAPPVPVNNDHNNNEQEEVKDLLDEHQKFDNIKDSQKEPGAGEDKAGGGGMDDSLKDAANDDINSHLEGKDRANEKNQEEDDQDQPLQNPIPEGDERKLPHPPEEMEGQQPVIDAPGGPVGGNEDDEDAAAADYKNEREEGEDEKNRVKEPVKQEEEVDEGKRAFLHDQEVFEQERLRKLQKEPRQGLAKEKEDQIKAMEKELHDQALPKKGHREIR